METPERILFHTGFLKGEGVPLHRNRAGHLTLDVMEICRKARASAHKGRQLQAASSFPATADEPSEVPSQSAPPPVAAEPVVPPPAIEKKYRLPSRQKMSAADLYKRTEQRAATRRQPVEVKGQEEPEAAVPPPVPVEVPVKGAPLPPHPPQGEDEVLPERELNLGSCAATTGETTPETLQKVRTPQASFEALPHEHSAVLDAETSELVLA